MENLWVQEADVQYFPEFLHQRHRLHHHQNATVIRIYANDIDKVSREGRTVARGADNLERAALSGGLHFNV